MYPTISCAFPGCTNPVIGQCEGYKDKCGRYYCAKHSAGRLCADCARQKQEDEIAQDYLLTAEKLSREIRFATLPLAILGLAGFGAVGYLLSRSNQDIALAVLCGGWLFIGIWTWIRQHNLEKERVTEIDRIKPGFSAFYESWKAERNKQNLKKGFTIISFIVVAILALIAQGAKDAFEERNN